ncbi:MAG: DUF1697 domain-containing protein [Actinomycetes bacterium]
MTTYVALLRGINVGGHNKVAMADLRRVVESLGHTNVATYVNSGNVVLDTDLDDARLDDGAALASQLEAAIERELDATPRVVVRSDAELGEVVRANPYADEPDPKKVHVVFLPEPPDEAALRAAKDRARELASKGSAERLEIVGRDVYLHTPAGLGRSELAGRVERWVGAGTARNWSTVTRLHAMCRERG